MHLRNRFFVGIALVYGLLGGLLALIRLADPALLPANAARIHGHMMLLGFILMMIYGIALHVLPRFGGFPLYSERMANLQLWVANTGLPVMIAGWWRGDPFGDRLVAGGGAASGAAMLLFGVNLILTVRRKRQVP